MIVSSRRYAVVMTVAIFVVMLSALIVHFDEYIFGTYIEYADIETDTQRNDVACEQASYSTYTEDGSDVGCPIRFIVEKGMEFLSDDVSASQLFFTDIQNVFSNEMQTHIGIYGMSVWSVHYRPSNADEGCYMRIEILRNCDENEVAHVVVEEELNGTLDTSWSIVDRVPDVEEIRMHVRAEN